MKRGLRAGALLNSRARPWDHRPVAHCTRALVRAYNATTYFYRPFAHVLRLRRRHRAQTPRRSLSLSLLNARAENKSNRNRTDTKHTHAQTPMCVCGCDKTCCANNRTLARTLEPDPKNKRLRLDPLNRSPILTCLSLAHRTS